MRLNPKTFEKYKNLHSVLIATSNDVLLEQYFPGIDGKGGYTEFNSYTLHDLRSATKSINSLLIGICIDKGYIKSVNEKVYKFLPEIENNLLEIKHLLTMTSGIDWDQSGLRKDNDIDDETEMEKSNNPVVYIVSKGFYTKPGFEFNYCSGDSILLGEIVQKATKSDYDKFLKKSLFDPLSIKNYEWWKPANRTYWTHAGLKMLPRDMIKIGQLMLNKGKHNGKSIISENWINKSHEPSSLDSKYGYQWWLDEVSIKNEKLKIVSAAGNGGQRIFIVPRLDLTVVFTAGYYHSKKQDIPNNLLINKIIPAYI